MLFLHSAVNLISSGYWGQINEIFLGNSNSLMIDVSGIDLGVVEPPSELMMPVFSIQFRSLG